MLMWAYIAAGLALAAAVVCAVAARRARAYARRVEVASNLQKEEDRRTAEGLREEAQRHEAEAAHAGEYRDAVVREVMHLAGARLPAMVGGLRHPGRPMPGLADPGLLTTPVSAASDQILRAVADAVMDERIRTDENAQEVLRTVMGSVRAQAAQAERLVELIQEQTSDPDLLKNVYSLDEMLVLMRREAQRTAVVCGDAPGTAREDTSLTMAVSTAQSRISGHQRVSVVNHVPRQDDGRPLGVRAPFAEPLIMMLAELLDNAVYCSVGSAQVRAELHRTATGVLVVVHDSGPGLDTVQKQQFAMRMLDAERRLMLTDLGSPTRLGMATVGRLKARFDGLTVTLDPSPARGVAVNVHIDDSMLVPVTERARPTESGKKLQQIPAPELEPAAQPRAEQPRTEQTPSALPSRSAAGGFPSRRRKSPDAPADSAANVRGPLTTRDPDSVGSAYAAMQSATQRARSERDADSASTYNTSWES